MTTNLSLRYQKLQQQISVKFNVIDLLDLAFVHRSYVNEHRNLKPEHNERLEFLGDAVLELVCTDFLFRNYPGEEEGTLTNWRSALVKGPHLFEIAEHLDLGFYLYLSRGEERSGGRKKNYLLANALEALIGAIYLDQGFDQAARFIQSFILIKLPQIIESGSHIDSKSKLQEYAQEFMGFTPTYKVVSSEGPDHQKTFTVALYIGEEKISEGSGASKQKAEQDAAAHGLKKILKP